MAQHSRGDLIRLIIGPLDTTPAAGAVTDEDLFGAYIKQLVTLLLNGVVLGTKVAAYKRLVGEDQIALTSEELNQTAGTYDLFTGTTNPVFLTTLSAKMPSEAAGGAVESIAIQTDDETPSVIFDAAAGALAKLTSEAEIVWTGKMRINVGTKIQLTLVGGAHGTMYPVTIAAECKAIVDGGYLAESA